MPVICSNIMYYLEFGRQTVLQSSYCPTRCGPRQDTPYIYFLTLPVHSLTQHSWHHTFFSSFL